MKCHKLIIRFDFPVSYGILDNPGQVMRMVDESVDIWNNIGENQPARQITASFKTDQEYYSYTVQPTNVVIEMENVIGISFKELSNTGYVKKLIKLTSSLFKTFDVEKIERGGARVFCGAGTGSFDEAKDKVESNLSVGILDAVKNSVGVMDDIAFNVDGHKNDLIYYKLRFGPYSPSEAERHFRHLHEGIGKEAVFNHIFDMDVYESKFSVLATPVHKWIDEALEYSSISLQALFKSIDKS